MPDEERTLIDRLHRAVNDCVAKRMKLEAENRRLRIHVEELKKAAAACPHCSRIHIRG